MNPNQFPDEDARRVERLLRQAAAWEPERPVPADLCARVAERIARRQSRPAPLIMAARYTTAVGAAGVLAVLALHLRGGVPQPVTDGSAPSAVVREWSPPRSRHNGIEAGAGMTLAGYHETPPASQLARVTPQTTPAKPAGEADGKKTPRRAAPVPRLKPAHPRTRRSERWYAHVKGQQSSRAAISTEPQAALATPPADGEVIAFIPVVLAEYEAETPDGEIQETLTPAIVAVSFKPDAFPPSEPQAAPPVVPQASQEQPKEP